MESIYATNDYRALIRSLFERRKLVDPSLTYQSLAEQIRVQKSYLSQVLGGRAELNADQAYLLARALEMTADERTYFVLLLEFSRTSLEERREELGAEIEKIQIQKRKSEEHLRVTTASTSQEDLTSYYHDAYNQLVHVCLSMEEFRKSPSKLAEALSLPLERFNGILSELQRLNLISVQASGIEVLKRNLHLPKDASVFRGWRAQMRNMALNQSMKLPEPETYNFSVIFSCTPEAKQELHDRFLKYLKDAQGLVNGAKPENVYQMSFDLVPWI